MKKIPYFSSSGNKKADIAKWMLDFFFLITLTACALMLVFSINTSENGGVPTFGKTSFWSFTSDELLDVGSYGASFTKVADSELKEGDVIGYKVYSAENGGVSVKLAKVVGVSNGVCTATAGGETLEIKTSLLLGKLTGQMKSSFFATFLVSKSIYLYLNVLPIAIFILVGVICYFILYPKKAGAILEEKFEEISAAKDEEKSFDFMEYIEKDDDIKPYALDDEALANIQNTNYYTSMRLKDGELYSVVKKFNDNIAALQRVGASDMDIIRVNMAGNTDFDRILVANRKEKTMTMQEVIDYASSLEDVYIIKKRGAINWTFKYKQKTIMLVRQGEGDGYKVSLKTYSDAAEKINLVYKALEDSNFPSGPIWYMFNDLRNLPSSVIKWLINESYRISQLQEVKTSILRENKTLEELGIDKEAIKAQLAAGIGVIPLDKFTVAAHRVAKEDKLKSMLDGSDLPGINPDDFVKEFFYPLNNRSDYGLSVLFKKNASEQLVNAVSAELDGFIENRIDSESTKVDQITASSATAKVVKKVQAKRSRR